MACHHDAHVRSGLQPEARQLCGGNAPVVGNDELSFIAGIRCAHLDHGTTGEWSPLDPRRAKDARRSDLMPTIEISAATECHAACVEPRIMYIESKAQGLIGPARIGRVTFSKSGRTLYYGGKSFQSLKGGYKGNYFELGTGDEYWISGPRRDGSDRLYGERLPVEIDDDVRVEYRTEVRGRPDLSEQHDAQL